MIDRESICHEEVGGKWVSQLQWINDNRSGAHLAPVLTASIAIALILSACGAEDSKQIIIPAGTEIPVQYAGNGKEIGLGSDEERFPIAEAVRRMERAECKPIPGTARFLSCKEDPSLYEDILPSTLSGEVSHITPERTQVPYGLPTSPAGALVISDPLPYEGAIIAQSTKYTNEASDPQQFATVTIASQKPMVSEITPEPADVTGANYTYTFRKGKTAIILGPEILPLQEARNKLATYECTISGDTAYCKIPLPGTGENPDQSPTLITSPNPEFQPETTVGSVVESSNNPEPTITPFLSDAEVKKAAKWIYQFGTDPTSPIPEIKATQIQTNPPSQAEMPNTLTLRYLLLGVSCLSGVLASGFIAGFIDRVRKQKRIHQNKYSTHTRPDSPPPPKPMPSVSESQNEWLKEEQPVWFDEKGENGLRRVRRTINNFNGTTKDVVTDYYYDDETERFYTQASNGTFIEVDDKVNQIINRIAEGKHRRSKRSFRNENN